MDNEATETETNEETAESENAEVEQVEAEDPSDGDKSTKILEKLQKRIGKEQAQKNDYKDQLDQALAAIERLKKGEDPDKPEEKDEKDNRIAQLEAQIKRTDTTAQARKVLIEGGINVPDEVLSLVVADDDAQTLDNVKALLGYTRSIQSAVREEFRKGSTPRVSGKAAGTTKASFDKMSPFDQLKLGASDPELYGKLINE